VQKKNNSLQKTIIFAGDYESVTEGSTTRQLYYVSGGDGLAAVYVKQAGQADRIYYVCTDHLGSIIKLIDSNGTEVFRASYDAWGRQTIANNSFAFHRGYTGHEHLAEFGLINMNGRMYDPVLGRFLSPDPYVQSPLFSQNFNRYAYCWNNPLRFTDPDGEWIHIVIGAIVGGVFNVVTNWDNINDFGQGLSYFGLGAAGGALMATGNIVAGGALMGGGNSILTQGFQNGFNNIDFNQVAMGATMGGITSYLGGQIGKGLQGPLSKLFSSVGSPMLREGLTYGTNGALTGFTLGTGMALAGGEDLGDAFKIGGKSALLGFGSGLGYGMYSGYKYAQTNNLNPVNGKPNQVASNSDNNSLTPYYPPNDGAVNGTTTNEYLMPGQVVDRYGSDRGYYLSDPDTPAPMRALPPNNTGTYNQYQVLKPIPVQKSIIAPWFNQPGGGIQYKSNVKIEVLLRKGFIIKF
jgi:RHS repeat-associated protein